MPSKKLIRKMHRHVTCEHLVAGYGAVKMTVGNQSFTMGLGPMSKKEHRWYKRMLSHALAVLVETYAKEAENG